MGRLSDGDDAGNTPLTDEASQGLKPSWVATRSDLNEVEADNVAKGYRWLTKTNPTPDQLLTSEFIRASHRQLFGDVWRWAGTYRQLDLNIGIDWGNVPTAVEQLVGNYIYQIEAAESGRHDEICVSFHHHLVSIHPFLNGNGRHARACADALALALGRPVFTWGYSAINSPSETRRHYIDALRSADVGDIAPLIGFARSASPQA